MKKICCLNDLRLWIDCWATTIPMCKNFPRGFAAAKKKQGLINDISSVNGVRILNLESYRVPSSFMEIQEWLKFTKHSNFHKQV